MIYMDPPDEYDWPWCKDYGLLMGADEETMRPGDDCPTCPMHHRCPDGAAVIRSRRDEEMVARDLMELYNPIENSKPLPAEGNTGLQSEGL